jgi:hypothetical protein
MFVGKTTQVRHEGDATSTKVVTEVVQRPDGRLPEHSAHGPQGC